MVEFFIDPSSLPAGLSGTFQVVFLGAVYSYVLYNASNLIADGSELLLLIPAWEKLVGSIVLPILGAVPDGAMVLFSGMGDNAKEEIAVGVGTLAGSTIMLLTIPFAASIINGMVPTRSDGSPDYSKRTQKLPSVWKGATANSSLINKSGYFMGITAISYLVVQFPAFYFTWMRYNSKVSQSNEDIFLLISIVICFILFVYYIYLCYSDQNAPINAVSMSKKEMKTVQLLKSGITNLEETFDRMLEEFELAGNSKAVRDIDFTKPLLVDDDLTAKFKNEIMNVLNPLFDECDYNDDNVIQYEEAYHLLSFFGACGNGPHKGKEITKIFEEYDNDLSGGLDRLEFFALIWNHIQKKAQRSRILDLQCTEKGENDEDSDHSIPEDLAHLEPEKRRTKIMRRALSMLALGTGLVLSFSDPMVSVLNELGDRSGVPAFYLAFVVAPLASNAAEAVASTQFSTKKTEKTMDVSLSALTGAAIMNNTFCLLVFLILAYVQKLEWTFGPEVMSILLVEGCMLIMTQRKYYTMKDAIMIMSLYPLSLAFVSFFK